MQGNRSRVALHGMMLLLLFTLSLQLLPFDLFALALALLTLPVRHLLLAVSFQQVALSGVALPLSVDGLRRRVLHGLADARQRVTGAVGRGRRVLAICGRLMGTSMALAQFRQPGEGVTGGLARRVIGA